MLIMGHSRERLIGSGKSCLLKNIGQDDVSSSKFYRTFPSIDAPVPDKQLQLGFFEDCTLGFSRQDKSHQSLYATTCDGIFLWSDVMLHRIGEIKFLGAKVLADKQLHMVGYMIELCYDLALSSDHNI
jgi:hypothetical protein